MSAPTARLVCNVYLWSGDDQTRLLTDALGPTVEELRREGLVGFFWFTRFDARGPHVMAILDAEEARRAEVSARVRACLDAYLTARPCTHKLKRTDLEKRHAECRGKRLCSIDAERGFAENNSYRLAGHGADDYPFRAAHGVVRAAELWRVVDDLCSWAVDRLTGQATAAASVRWIAAVDGALARTGASGAAFWEHHARTLLPGIGEKLEMARDEVLGSLAAVVGPRNRTAFDRVWHSPDPDPAAAELAGKLMELVMDEDGRTLEQRWALLREVDHCLLSQLGQPVKLHIPLVLYAWFRNLASPACTPL